MKIINKSLQIVLLALGSAAIVGTGFCTWISSDELNFNDSIEASTNLSITDETRVGQFYFPNEKEARERIIDEYFTSNHKKPTYSYNGKTYEFLEPLYNFSKEQYSFLTKSENIIIPNSDPNLQIDGLKVKDGYEGLRSLLEQRKIVFAEGDLATGNDGLEFQRMKYSILGDIDNQVEIVTYVPENSASCYYLIEEDEYNKCIKKGLSLKVGLAEPKLLDSSNNVGLDDYIKVDDLYAETAINNELSFTYNGVKYLEISNPNNQLFKWHYIDTVKGVSEDATAGSLITTNFKRFQFEVDLQGMFSYINTSLIPDTPEKIRKIYNEIHDQKNKDFWSINFNFIATFM